MLVVAMGSERSAVRGLGIDIAARDAVTAGSVMRER
jgi:hypothetical protein